MDKREEIQKVLIHFSEGDIWINKATDDILALFNVVGQSEHLVCDCMPDPKCRIEDNKVICNGCDKERK